MVWEAMVCVATGVAITEFVKEATQDFIDAAGGADSKAVWLVWSEIGTGFEISWIRGPSAISATLFGGILFSSSKTGRDAKLKSGTSGSRSNSINTSKADFSSSSVDWIFIFFWAGSWLWFPSLTASEFNRMFSLDWLSSFLRPAPRVFPILRLFGRVAQIWSGSRPVVLWWIES